MYKLSKRQILMRIISAFVTIIGVSTCAFSFTLQIQAVGSLTASITWFTGLGAVVAGIAGIAVTTEPAIHKTNVAPIVTLIAVGAILGTIYEVMNFGDIQAILTTLVFLLIEVVCLCVYHYLLKKDDPDALWKERRGKRSKKGEPEAE